MKSLWALEEGTVAQVQQRLRPARNLAYTTVMTLLDRLDKKGAVSRRKEGRSYVYRPILTRRAELERALDRLVEDFFNGSREELRAYLTGAAIAVTEAAQSEEEPIDSVLL